MKQASYGKQALIIVIAGLLVRLIGFVYRIPLTIIIGDEGNGIYGKAFNIFIFFMIISSAGIPTATSKMISERLATKQYKNAHKVFLMSLILTTIFGFISALIMWFGAELIAGFLNSPESVLALKTLAPTVFIVSIMAPFKGYFQGMRNTIPTAISQVIEQLFNAIFSVYLAYILIGTSVEAAAAGGTAGTGIGAIAGLIPLIIIYFLVKSNLNKKILNDSNDIVEDNFKIIKEILFTSTPIILGVAIFSLTNFIDMKMVTEGLLRSGEFTTQEINSLYGQLTGKYIVICTLPVAIAGSIASTTIPNIARDYKLGKKDQLDEKITLSLKYSMLIVIPSSVGIAVLANQILMFLFPTQPEGGILLQIGALSIIFLSLNQVFTSVLQGLGYLKIPIFAAVLGGLCKIPINYFLIQIPQINVIGAIISTTVCYMIASLINFVFVLKVTNIKFDYNDIFIKPTIASLVMGMFCYVIYYTMYLVLPTNWIVLIITVLLGALIYLTLLLLFSCITKEDILKFPLGDKIVKIIK